MKILLVEDDENKRGKIIRFLGAELPDIEVVVAASLQSGLRAAKANRFDVVILDMTLPTYDTSPDEPGGGTEIFGGRQFLRQLRRFDIDIPVVVVTQFEYFGSGTKSMSLADLDQQLHGEFKDQYMGAVYYHAAIAGWQDQLLLLLRSVSSASNQSDG